MNPAADTSFLTIGRMGRIGTALLFDLTKFVFGIILLLAPVIAGSLLGSAAAAKCNSLLQDIPGQGLVCGAAKVVVNVTVTVAGGLLEYGTGVGEVAIGFISEVFDDAIDAMAWIALILWCFVAGISFSKGKRGTQRLFAAAMSAGAGLIPFVNLFPTITAGQVMIEVFDYKDKKEAARQAPVQSQTDVVALQREHLAALREQRALKEQAREEEA